MSLDPRLGLRCCLAAGYNARPGSCTLPWREGEREREDSCMTHCPQTVSVSCPAGKWPVGVNPDQEPAHCETGGLIKDKECRSGQSAVSVPNNYVV